MKIKRIIPAILGTLAILAAFPSAAYSEGRTGIREEDRGTLVLEYRESGEKGKAVPGAEFSIEQLTRLSGEAAEDGTFGMAWEPLVTDENGNPIVIGPETSAADIEEAVRMARLSGSAGGVRETSVTDREGRARIEGLPPGQYLVQEIKAADGYVKSKAFLVSVPKTADDGSGWEFEVTAWPKPEKKTEEPPYPGGAVRTGDANAPAWMLLLCMLLSGTAALAALTKERRNRE